MLIVPSVAVNDFVSMVELRHKYPWFTRAVRDLLRDKERAQSRKKNNRAERKII